MKEEVCRAGLSGLRELRQLRKENAKLERLVADLSLDRHTFQGSLQKVVKSRQRREFYGRVLSPCLWKPLGQC